jgi:hypothetical protein
MASGPAGNPPPSAQGLLAQRSGPKPSKAQSRKAFWRTLALARPHRRRLILGLVLGFGVALTYAGTLGGMLPVLQAIVGEEPIHTGSPKKPTAVAEDSPGTPGPAPAPWTAGCFPAEDAAAKMRTLLILLGGIITLNLVGNVFRVLQPVPRPLRQPSHDDGPAPPDVPQGPPRPDDPGSPATSPTASTSSSPTPARSSSASPRSSARSPASRSRPSRPRVALVLDARLTLVALAIAPVAIGLLWYFGRKVRKATVRLLEGYGVMLGGLEETLQGVDTVKGYGREGHERRRMWQIERRMLKQILKLAWIEAIASPLIEVIGILIASAGVVWLASQQTFSGDIEPSQFILMVGLLAAMLDPVRKIANVYNMVQRAGAASTRVWDFLDEPEEASPPAPQTLKGTPRAPSASRTSRSATPRRRNRRPCATSPSTSHPASASPSSAPTAPASPPWSRWLPRLLEPDAGRVLIDGTDVRDYQLRNLRMQIAVVSQRPAIFARSVFDNIAYGKDGATARRGPPAARRPTPPSSSNSGPTATTRLLGEYGTSVSGGQRQRISIARAFLKPASILIFDEATSEIDAESERKIHDALASSARARPPS